MKKTMTRMWFSLVFLELSYNKVHLSRYESRGLSISEAKSIRSVRVSKSAAVFLVIESRFPVQNQPSHSGLRQLRKLEFVEFTYEETFQEVVEKVKGVFCLSSCADVLAFSPLRSPTPRVFTSFQTEMGDDLYAYMREHNKRPSRDKLYLLMLDTQSVSLNMSALLLFSPIFFCFNIPGFSEGTQGLLVF